jgi:protein-disulfide isomerase
MARKQQILLVVLILLGILSSYTLSKSPPLGRDLSESAAVTNFLADRRSPHVIYGDGGLTVIAFIDYQCPACRIADKALRSAAARDGNIRVIYRDWPVFGPLSERAAQVALASDRQGIYPALHYELMRSPSLGEAALREAVARAGGNWEKLQTDLAVDRPTIEAQLAENRRDAASLGLKGTPSYLIGTLLVEGALVEGEFVRAFKKARPD